jgi:hypothetical protein
LNRNGLPRLQQTQASRAESHKRCYCTSSPPGAHAPRPPPPGPAPPPQSPTSLNQKPYRTQGHSRQLHHTQHTALNTVFGSTQTHQRTPDNPQEKSSARCPVNTLPAAHPLISHAKYSTPLLGASACAAPQQHPAMVTGADTLHTQTRTCGTVCAFDESLVTICGRVDHTCQHAFVQCTHIRRSQLWRGPLLEGSTQHKSQATQHSTAVPAPKVRIASKAHRSKQEVR